MGIRMKRDVSLEEISDGRLYGRNDMVKADCHGCKGCFQCCMGMGNSVLLDPCDVYRLQTGLGKTLSRLLEEEKVELNVVNGLILPNLKMTGKNESCAFLNGEGRCGIHESRPGLCRLFPLGRFYENGDFRYFLQNGQCADKTRSKIKVSKWIDIPRQAENHAFVCKWHDFLERMEEEITETGRLETGEGMEAAKGLNIRLLRIFFLTPYEPERDFYEQFEERFAGFSF